MGVSHPGVVAVVAAAAAAAAAAVRWWLSGSGAHEVVPAARCLYCLLSAVSHASAAPLLASLAFALPPCTTLELVGVRGPRARPASLLLLAVWLSAAVAELACPGQAPPPPPPCAACASDEDLREHNLRVIRESLLAKLGFTAAPNTTGRELPRVPPEVMRRYKLQPSATGTSLQADAPSRTLVTHIEPDDFLARTDNVLVFAR